VDEAGAESAVNYIEKRNISLAIGALALIAGITLAFFITRHITRATGQLNNTVAKLAQGDYEARSRVASGDELQDLSMAFDSMLDDRLATLAKKEKENDALNASIMDLLRAVSKLSRGDLTVKAPVREDITGALADAINSMSDATAKTLGGVNSVSHEVRSASQGGRDTVLSTAKGMNEIRGSIQETGKRIKRLGERSQEITGIVKLIDDIAERTSVLALNANMQAAMAGEAGRGFRVVADEVQRLAERSKEATDQIAKLVTAIQTETNDTIATMDNAIGEVVRGGELAELAAQQVTHLDDLGGELIASVGAFTLPPEYMLAEAAPTSRRAA
jgi:methyl-accepting chemotaxis protein